MRMSVGARRAGLKRRIAYHEAGHAVAAVLLKRQFEYVTIKRIGDLGGHMAYSIARERKRSTPRMTQAIVALAGPMAEGRHSRRKAAKLLRGEDVRRIAELKLSEKKYVYAVGVALVLVAWNWPSIKAVAKALQRTGTLTELAVLNVMKDFAFLARSGRFPASAVGRRPTVLYSTSRSKH